MAINDELLYEVNERGERVVVKSVESIQQAFLRFTNLTQRPVDVWWRDFKGIRRHYVRLEPNSYYHIDSFISHPWEFTDAATKEHYTVSNKKIFRAPANVGGMMYRTNWNITIGMRTLRETAMLAIAMKLSCPDFALDLNLPQLLQDELSELIETLNYQEPEQVE